GGSQIITDLFLCFIPNGRAINPITETNWEGTGVKPDFEIERDKALLKAKSLALDSLNHKAENEDDKLFYEWHLTLIESEMNPYKADAKKMKSQTGKFGPRNLLFENNTLHYQRDGLPKYKMTALSETKYFVPGPNIMIE